MHIGYATIVGVSLYRYGGRPFLRAAAALYPALQLLVIVATGNHFFFDAASGALVAGLAALVAVPLTRGSARRRRRAIGTRLEPVAT
jgi:PAP2 superfamily